MVIKKKAGEAMTGNRNIRNVVLVLMMTVVVFLATFVSAYFVREKIHCLSTQRDQLAEICETSRDTVAEMISVEATNEAHLMLQTGENLLNIVSPNTSDTIRSDAFSQAKEIVTLFDDELDAAIKAYRAEQRKATIRAQMASRSGMMGRFVVPSVGIDVALYYNGLENWMQVQGIVDAADSAACIDWMCSPSLVFADHRSQAFRTLTSITPGMKARIETGDAATTKELVCTYVIDGINDKINADLKNTAGESVRGTAAYICYTCHYNYTSSNRSVRIVGWDPVS